MPLLDGKYEIIAERPVDGTQTLFEATAPDGSAVTIIWFELATAELEWAFQSYRQTLRALKRRGLAAIFDLVSRPGAHYVAWHRPPTGEPLSLGSFPALQEALRELGRRPAEADVRVNSQGKPQIYGLAFNENLATSQPSLPVIEPAPLRAKRAPLDRARLAPWLLGFGLAGLGVGLFTLSFFLRADNSLVVVPPLLGEEVNAAASALYRLGLAVEAEAVPSSREAGEVLGLEPQAGTQLRRGRTVTLRYALPPGRLAQLPVPELRGQLLDGDGEVARLLEPGRFEIGRVARITADIPRGTILAQSPPAGGRLPSGGAVDVLVSDGPREALTFLPDLRGLLLEEALELARLAGLSETRITQDFVAGAGGVAGTVLEQSLPPFTPFSRDLAVLRLTVAGGPSLPLGASTMPDLWTMSQREAELALEEAGFRVGRVQEIQNPSLPQGVVIQSQAAGTLLGESDEAGNVVDLTVNVPPVAVAAVEPSVELREPPPCEFPYSFVLEGGIAEGNVVVIAQIRGGNPQPIMRTQAGGGEVVEGTWTITDPGPVTFGLTYNGYPYPQTLQVSCHLATEN